MALISVLAATLVSTCERCASRYGRGGDVGLKAWIGRIWCVKDIIRVSPRLEVGAVFTKPARRFVSKTRRCRVFQFAPANCGSVPNWRPQKRIFLTPSVGIFWVFFFFSPHYLVWGRGRLFRAAQVTMRLQCLSSLHKGHTDKVKASGPTLHL